MIDRWTRDPSRLVTFDPLEVPLENAVARSSQTVRVAPSRWLGLGWSATSIPIALLLLIGIGFGPYGVNLLSSPVLEFLDPAMPVALAVLGVLVGLAVGVRRPGDPQWLIIAGIEPILAVAAVAIATALAPTAVTGAPAIPRLMLGLFAGVCAANSLGMPTGTPSAPHTTSARVAEFEAGLLVAIGGFVLVSIRESSLLSTISLATQSCAVALVLATAGRLLLTRTSSETEQRVITLATLMLVGGVADYLAFSPLLGGVIAGVLWQLSGGSAPEWMRRDALYVQHPLVVTLLLVAGARAEPSSATLALAGAYAFLRCFGKVAAGSFIQQFAARTRVPHDLGLPLIRPGLFGVALALDALRTVGSDMSVFVTVIVVGTIGSELLAGLLDRRETTE